MDELQYSSALTGGDELPIAGLRLKANPALLLPLANAEIIPDLIRRKIDVLVGLFVWVGDEFMIGELWCLHLGWEVSKCNRKGVKLNYYIVIAIENKGGYKLLNGVRLIYLLIRRK